jgi:carbamoyltransferase
MYILGISAYYHDSAACLIYDGNIIAAAQEERFTRKKHDSSFPHYAIEYCLKESGITEKELTNIVFYEKPFLKFERLIETYLAYAPRGFISFSKSMPLWIKDKLFQKNNISNELSKILGNKKKFYDKLLFSEHHLSHAASAFFPSPFNNAAIITLDGVGEWSTSSIAIGNRNKIEIIKEIHFPHSLGLLYSAFTYYLGFKVNSGEYKLMGLAPYGEPKYKNIITDNLIKIKSDGSFHLDMTYFNYATGLKMTNSKFNKLFGGPPRTPETKLSQKDMDIASSIQKVIEDVIIKIANHASSETKLENLCLAGGVALNCVANGVLQREKIFKNIWIQPASGDAGGALGCALAVWHMHYEKDRKVNENDSMRGSFLGPSFNNEEIETELNKCGAIYSKIEDIELIDRVSSKIIESKAIGWMQGRMEFGPRALGARSIIADPRSPDMQKQLNLKVKYRESFRPFAPSILKEYVGEWFEIRSDSDYMMFVSHIKENKKIQIESTEEMIFGIDKLNIQRSAVPSVTHVDYSARIHTVKEKYNSLYYKLLSKFNEKTGCPILINTSFNIRGEPIVCTPKEAFNCFMGTDLDVLVIGNFFLEKHEQNKKLIKNYKKSYELD